MYLRDEDLSVSKPPKGVTKEPTNLRKFHLEVYISKRNSSVCRYLDCLHLVPLGANVSGYCPLNFTLFDLGAPDRPKQATVQFADGDFPQNANDINPRAGGGTEGLTFTSPSMIRKFTQEALESGRKSELHVAKYITSNYGCSLLENAALLKKRWPIIESTPKPVSTANDPLRTQQIIYPPPY